jgi:hypothetical protein
MKVFRVGEELTAFVVRGFVTAWSFSLLLGFKGLRFTSDLRGSEQLA